MNIDWTKPCETCEDPPRPVRVLCTDAKGIYPVVIAIDNTGLSSWGGGEILERRPINGLGNPQIRNVPPPKPEPVLREAWVNLYPNGRTETCYAKDTAEILDKDSRLECRRIVWNSDGSPVVDENLGDFSILQMENQGLRERIATLEKDNAGLERDRDAWKAKAEEALRLLADANIRRDQDITLIESLEADLAQLKRNEHSLVREIARQREAHAEQVKRMQEQIDGVNYFNNRLMPIVNAATAYIDAPNLTSAKDRLYRPLYDAVRSYHRGETEKSCENCRNWQEDDCHYNRLAMCGGIEKWEPRR